MEGADQLEMFCRTRMFLDRERQRLARRPRTDERQRQVAELSARTRQLAREFNRWRENYAA